MAKAIVTMSIDQDTHQQAKKLIDNMSHTVEEFLNNLIMQQQQDTGEIDLELEQMEIKKLEKEISEKSAEYKSRVLAIERAKEALELKRKELLQKEKEDIESQKKCSHCGSVHDENYKWKVFGEYRICTACFHTANGEQVKKWMKSSKQ